MRQSKQNTRRLYTGLQDVDRVLPKGLPPGGITEVVRRPEGGGTGGIHVVVYLDRDGPVWETHLSWWEWMYLLWYVYNGMAAGSVADVEVLL